MASLTDSPRSSTPAPPPKGGLSADTFSAFKSRPFLLLWLNSFSFSLAQAVRQFAFVWLALELSKDASVLGLISFALGIPVLIFVLPAGTLADRVDRRLLMFGSQIAALVLTALSAVLVMADAMTIEVTIALAAALGGTVAFGQPVRSAIVPSLVEKDRILNAVTLMGLSQNVSQIAGPALAGAVIALAGVGSAFAVQAVLLGIGLIALIPMRVPAPANAGTPRNMRAELREGFSFVAGHAGIRTLMFMLLATALMMGGTFQTLLPKIAKEDLDSGALGASLLFGAMGAGMLCSSLLLASLRRFDRGGMYFLLTLVTGGFLNTAVVISPVYLLSFFFMFIVGWNAGFFSNLNLTLIQAHTPQKVMGRVMALYTFALMGGQPIGSLLAGTMADVTGAIEWYVICAMTMSVVGVIALITQPSLRRMRSTPPPDVVSAPVPAMLQPEPVTA